jgi:hypothetical protein
MRKSGNGSSRQPNARADPTRLQRRRSAVRVEGYVGCLERVILRRWGVGMQDLACEVRRILIPRTRMNKGMRMNRGSSAERV